MKNMGIQDSLIEMRENLEKLESAREQVQKVSTKSIEVIGATDRLTKSIEELKAKYDEEGEKLLNSFDNASHNFKENYKAVIKEYEDYVKTFKSIQQENNATLKASFESLNNSINIAQKNIEDIDIELGFKKTSKSIESLSSNLSNSMNEMVEELSGHFDNTNRSLHQIKKMQAINMIILSVGAIAAVAFLIYKNIQ